MKSQCTRGIAALLPRPQTRKHGIVRRLELSANPTDTPKRAHSRTSFPPHILQGQTRLFSDRGDQRSGKSYETPSSELNHDVTEEEKVQFDRAIAKDKDKSIRTPWHREGSDKKPVSRMRSAGAMTKGKLLTTPTRLFKLILPLTVRDHNSDRKDAEPLALLIHPSQPLSYLERLIQSELPLLTVKDREKIPDVNFRAEDAMTDDSEEKGKSEGRKEARDLEEYEGQEDETHTHLRSRSPEAARELRGGPGEGGVESYSGIEDSIDTHPENFVRWSKSTEVGDFIRDAARGKEFAVEIEGAPSEIRVGVPSFGDRTYYLRLRLRKKAKQIASMAEIKRECDIAAHHYSQRVAYAGFGGMTAWAGVVAWLTFMTNLGWDVMEPVTYLVGLVGLLGGYAWFLAHNREVSYRSALNLTVSRRLQRLYEEKSFDLKRYESLVEEGNSLRKEIMAIANEYDVDWDEKRDTQDEKVVQALAEKRKEKKSEKKKDDDDDEDE